MMTSYHKALQAVALILNSNQQLTTLQRLLLPLVRWVYTGVLDAAAVAASSSAYPPLAKPETDTATSVESVSNGGHKFKAIPMSVDVETIEVWPMAYANKYGQDHIVLITDGAGRKFRMYSHGPVPQRKCFETGKYVNIEIGDALAFSVTHNPPDEVFTICWKTIRPIEF